MNTHDNIGQCIVGKVGVDEGLYVGRGSIYGNPYRVTGERDSEGWFCESRESAIKRYSLYLDSAMKISEPSQTQSRLRTAILSLASRLLSGENLVLLCFCDPLDCHARIIAETALAYARSMTVLDSPK